MVPVERLAPTVGGIGLPMRADAAHLAAAERASGEAVPERIARFLAEYPQAGLGLFDPDGHAAHSPALHRLIESVEAEHRPLGAIGPAAGGPPGPVDRWYLVFETLPGHLHCAVWDDCRILQPSRGTEGILAAEAAYGIALPASYRHLVCVFAQVFHSAFHMHEGLIEPGAGQSPHDYEAELEYMRGWLRAEHELAATDDLLKALIAEGEYAVTPLETVDQFLPIYADAYGNLYLFERRNPGLIFRFDHDGCEIEPTDFADFDSFFDALLATGLE